MANDEGPKDPNEIRKLIEKSMLNKMERALATVELDAKRNCKFKEGSGPLKASITHKKAIIGDEIIGALGSPLEYAVYVHQGTGLYAVNGDGRKEVPWHYKDPLTGEWRHTKGQKPIPFLQKAIDDNKKTFDKIFGAEDKLK
jgi:hypothetical protein